jgi:proteasome lid subunit RPN8/RPN11
MTMIPVNLSPEARNTMEKDAIESFPNECCGFFYGSLDGSREVEYAVPVTNIKEGDKRRRFTIDPLDYMKAEKHAIENGKTLLGIYHSHPLHPAVPSEHDRSQAMPWFSYIILSVDNDNIEDLRSYQLDEFRQFQEEPISN